MRVFKSDNFTTNYLSCHNQRKHKLICRDVAKLTEEAKISIQFN